MSLLNNLVYFLKQDVPQTVDLPDRIAREAFQAEQILGCSCRILVAPGACPGRSCTDARSLFISCWLISGIAAVQYSSEYEKLMDEAETINLSTSASQVRTDS